MSHVCAILLDGTLTCWGSNTWGQLDAPEGSYLQIVAGDYHSCAAWADGAVACWGIGPEDAGVDGYDDHRDREQVSDTPAGSFLRLAGGGETSCGITSHGRVDC